jgi:Ca2+-binding RTX toxin-like protein
MKRLLAFVASFVSAFALSAGIVAAAPAQPSECTATYTRTVELNKPSSYFKGTNANELVIVNGGNSYVDTGGGADCIVINTGNNYVLAGAGNDVVVANAGNNSLNGQGGTDALYSYAGGDYLSGGAGSDTCVYDENTTAANSCEL